VPSVRIKEWIKLSRHVLLREFFEVLNLRLLGHYRYYGVRGNSRSLYRYFAWVKLCVFKWLNRRGGKRGSLSWARFVKCLEYVELAQPRITEGRWSQQMA
jgi:RNA-directed DNA polymerase